MKLGFLKKGRVVSLSEEVRHGPFLVQGSCGIILEIFYASANNRRWRRCVFWSSVRLSVRLFAVRQLTNILRN